MSSKIYEVAFTFTPEDADQDTSNGLGFITITARSETEAVHTIKSLLEEVKDLEITSIKALADVPSDIIPHEAHRSLQ